MLTRPRCHIPMGKAMHNDPQLQAVTIFFASDNHLLQCTHEATLVAAGLNYHISLCKQISLRRNL